MDKSDMMDNVGKEISNYIKTYENYTLYSVEQKIQLNKSEKFHYVKFQFKIKESNFLFDFLFQYDNGEISTTFNYDAETIIKSDELKIDSFYEFFKIIPREKFIKIYELTNWK